jgi:hypothetical protein
LKGDSIDLSIDIGEVARILACSLGMAFAMILATEISSLKGAIAVGMNLIIGSAAYLALIFAQPTNRASIVQLAKSVRNQ